MTSSRHRLLAALVVAALLTVSACGGGSTTAQPSPEQVLAAAKKNLDNTSGVHIVLATDKLPPGVSGIVKADGIGTHPPAFQGTIKVVAAGVSVDVPVVSVDEVVYAKLPFTTRYDEIKPGDYGAPDPSDLLAGNNGLSSLLTSVENVKEGKKQRDGATVLDTYTGTLPGRTVSGIIPSADAASDFDATFTVTADNVLHEAVLTGPFYPKADDVTYTVAFDQYDTTKDITKP